MADSYQKLELIGSGTFGRVWLVEALKSRKRYVIKEIQVSGLTQKEREQTLTEVSVLARCKHVNIVRYHDAFVHDAMLNIVMEHAEGGAYIKPILPIFRLVQEKFSSYKQCRNLIPTLNAWTARA